MSKEANVILVTVEAIKNGRLEELDRCLKIMPVESLDVRQVDSLFSTFINLCTEYNRKECCRYVLDRWKVTFPEDEKTSMLTKLFMKRMVTEKSLAFVILSIYKDYTYIELMDELAEYDRSEEVITACLRADKVFGPQKLETYTIVRDNAVLHENYKLEEYAILKLEENAPFAEKPNYVKNYLGELYPEYKNKLLKAKELDRIAEEIDMKGKELDKQIMEKIDEIPLEESLKLLTEGLENSGVSIVEIESAKKFLSSELENPERKKELLMPILRAEREINLETDRVLFWIYGPNNQLVNQNLTLNTPSSKYGGCRMFLCDLFDYDEEEGEVLDWFTGSCDQCLKRIKKRCYAVRMPRVHGGWEGCFCSFKCVDDNNTEMEIKTNDPNLLLRELITLYSEKVEEVGIQETL